MNREAWDKLIGHLRSELVSRSRDPDLWIDARFDQREILIQSDDTDDGGWVKFDMDSEYDDHRVRGLAVKMVAKALGSS